MDLAQYMSRSIEELVQNVFKASLSNPKESAFILKYMGYSKKAAKKRSRLEAEGRHVPPFLIASIAADCNLFCKGCYARANQSCGDGGSHSQLTCAQWKKIFGEAAELGIAFILLAGGEPLLRSDVIEAASGFPQIVFPVFTNGTIMDDEYLDLFNKSRNLVPVISLEGDKSRTDGRRGNGIYDKLTAAMDRLYSKRILFGTSITVTAENLDEVTAPSFVSDIQSKGCGLVFYVEYVPADASTAQLVLDSSQRRTFEERLQALRQEHSNMVFLAFPGDEKHMGGCLAAGRGFFHINASGGAEPCPFSPYSDISLKEHTLMEALQSPLFRRLESEGLLREEHTGGCVLFEQQARVSGLLRPL